MMRFDRLLMTLSLMGICSLSTQAQSTYLPLGNPAYPLLDRLEIKSGRLSPDIYTTVKPFFRKSVVQYVQHLDSLAASSDTSLPFSLSKVDQYLIRELEMDNEEWLADANLLPQSKRAFLKHFYKTPAHFYEVRQPDFFLTIDPLLQLNAGKDKRLVKNTFINTRGIEVRGLIGKKLGFYTYFTENQERGPLFFHERVNQWQAVPGIGYYKDPKPYYLDYTEARAYITFNIIPAINLQFGYDKNFIGNGYRSLLLSDYSSPYLFLKLNTQVWKLNYQNIFAELISQYDRSGGDYLRPKKYVAMHHLSLNATHWLNIGFFENITFSRANYFEFTYLNPIIFYRAAEYTVGSPDKVMEGLDWKALIAHRFQFYGMFLLNEFKVKEFFGRRGWWGNKWGLQLGGKYVDAFGIRSLDLQAEINLIRPYTYTHYDTVANYTHYNQPLAHPLGANFREFIGLARYQPLPRLLLTARAIYYEQGLDEPGQNWGSNIFLNYYTRQMEYGNHIGQGVFTRVINGELAASYEWKHRLYLDLSYLYRKAGSQDPAQRQTTSFFSAGMRWNLARRNYDY